VVDLPTETAVARCRINSAKRLVGRGRAIDDIDERRRGVATDLPAIDVVIVTAVFQEGRYRWNVAHQPRDSHRSIDDFRTDDGLLRDLGFPLNEVCAYAVCDRSSRLSRIGRYPHLANACPVRVAAGGGARQWMALPRLLCLKTLDITSAKAHGETSPAAALLLGVGG
jgi:hypothetical protein